MMLAIMMVGQRASAVDLPLIFCGEQVTDLNCSDIRSTEYAQPYNSAYGDYKIWMDYADVSGRRIWTLHLRNALVNYTGGMAFLFDLGLDEDLVFDIQAGDKTSKIVAKGPAIAIQSSDPNPKLAFYSPIANPDEALILESTEGDALLMSGFSDKFEIHLHAHLQVVSKAPAASKLAAINCLTKGQLYMYGIDNALGGSYLKAKSNYATFLGIDEMINNDVATTTFNFGVKEYEDVGFASYNATDEEQQMTSDWCYVNNTKKYPVWVAGTQVTDADTWGEGGVQSPYITSGTVKFKETWGDYVVYLSAATIEIPEEVTDVPGISCTEGSHVYITVEKNPEFVTGGEISRINVLGGDGIRADGGYTQISGDDAAETRYLFIKSKTGINIKNETGMPYYFYVSGNITLETQGETGIKLWGDETTSFNSYLYEEDRHLKINSTGPAIVLESKDGCTGAARATFDNKGKLIIVSDGDGISLKDAGLVFTGNIQANIEARGGAAINANKSMSTIRKETGESLVRLMGSAGVINDIYTLPDFNGGIGGEMIQADEAEDAKWEKLNAPFWTYCQGGQPYANKVAEMRVVERYFKIGDYELNDHTITYFDKLIPGVTYDPVSFKLTLEGANIKATGENVGLKSLMPGYSYDIVLKGAENVIEAESTGMLIDCDANLSSEDGKGKLTVKSTAGKGIVAKDGHNFTVSDCTLDVTAEQEAFWNEDSNLYMYDCEASFSGNGGGYYGAQTASILQLSRATLTCTGSEIDGNVKASCYGYNLYLYGYEELLTAGFAVDYGMGFDFWVKANNTGDKTGKTIQFGVKPDNLYYDIRINGIDMTASNCGDIRPTGMKSGNISYDPVEHVLTLDNVVMDVGYFSLDYGTRCSKVLLKGENFIESSNGNTFFTNYVPITITSEDGTGTLIFNGVDAYPSAIDLQSDLIIENCNVDITGKGYVCLNGNGYTLYVNKANASFNGTTGSMIGLGGLVLDGDAWDAETSIIAPAGAAWNSGTGDVEVGGYLVVDEPVVIHYAKRYNISANSTEYITADNCADFKPMGLTSGKISYDPENNVLTFDNINMNDYLSIGVQDPITIMLVGKNKVKLASGWVWISKGGIIKSEDGGELAITSDYRGIEAGGDLTIEDCRVTILAANYQPALSVYDGTLTVNNAYLRSEGTPSIHAEKGLILGEGMEITDPYGAMFNKLTGDVEVNGHMCTDEVLITKPATIATTVPVKVTNAGAAGFSSNKALDFTGLPVSAWVSTGMRNGNIMLSRVFKVAAGTGLYLKGKAGEEVSCDVPIIEDDSYYANMFVGVPAGKKIDEKEGTIMIPDYFRTYYFALSTSTNQPTFYPTPAEGKTLLKNKMYMRMPADVDPNDMAGELEEETVEVTVGKAGAAGFSCDKALDFTDSEITAWIATGFSGGNIQLSRVFAVPANTGVYLKGKAGETITANIPVTKEKPYYRSFFRPTDPVAEILVPGNEWDDETGLTLRTLYFALSKSTNQPTFYPVDIMEGKKLGPNKMYMVLPVALMPEDPAPAREIGLEFLEDDVLMLGTEATGVIDIDAEQFMSSDAMQNARGTFDLQGRRIDASNAKKGMYIQNGRVVIKK